MKLTLKGLSRIQWHYGRPMSSNKLSIVNFLKVFAHYDFLNCLAKVRNSKHVNEHIPKLCYKNPKNDGTSARRQKKVSKVFINNSSKYSRYYIRTKNDTCKNVKYGMQRGEHENNDRGSH